MKDIDIIVAVSASVLPGGQGIAGMTPSCLASALTALGVDVCADDGKDTLISEYNGHLGRIATEAAGVAVSGWFQEFSALPARDTSQAPEASNGDDDDDDEDDD